LELKRLIDSITEAGLREKVKVMIGGAPVTQDFANDIGADGYADDAIAAVEVARRLADAAA
jgi:5-methyltetrahydrofolate--homocysteine methyltransferase